jgi:ATP-binding cassette subfamily A (ABC1) protein 5
LSGCSFIGTCDQLSLGADYLSKYQVWIMYVACFIHIIWFFFDLRVKDVQADGLKTAEAWKVACFMKRREDRGQSNPEEGDKDEEEVEEEEDSDVNEERLLISNYMGRAPEYSAIQRVVAVKGLRKEFEKTDATNAKAKKDEKNKESKKKIAVRNLTLAVEEGEVFGLLGHNGAGKTTSMKIITAEEAPTRGKVRIDKYDITNNMSPGFEHLGYCPQVRK